ncbi:MAG TPA: helix-turn-helix transcriptional regulator [Malonomonas sp.]
MELRHAPSVAIDGAAIRRIREEKRLTQFYVAKVVAVTTDTVSRWENNRYPTIRRDNALKLAEALEVDIDDILKQEDVIEEEIFAAEETPATKRWPYLLLLAVLVGAAITYFAQENRYHPPVIEAKRYLPPYAAPGSRILVRVKLSSEKPLKGMILREEFPKGWKLVEADPLPSSLDNLEGMARWIFRSPTTQTSVSYKLEVEKNALLGEFVKLSGELIANPDGRRFEVALQDVGTMKVEALHWADTNGNQIIEDLEILEVSDLVAAAGKLHLEWDLIEKIWDTGGYQWDESKNQFVPVRPKNSLETQ